MNYRGREELLESMVAGARRVGWNGDFNSEWAAHDVELLGGLWHYIRITTATEELGWPRRFTRARCTLRLTSFAFAVITVCSLLTIIALTVRQPWMIGGCGFQDLAVAAMIIRSARRCSATTARLLWRAGRAAGLEAVESDKVTKKMQEPPPQPERRAEYRAPATAVAFNLAPTLSRDIHEKV